MLRFQKNAWIAILGSTLALAACQPKQAAEDAAKAASATDSSTQAQALAIEGKTVKLNADLPECDGNNCPEFEIERLQSNMPWIDQQIDAEILNNLARILEISKSVKVVIARQSLKPALPVPQRARNQSKLPLNSKLNPMCVHLLL